MYVGTNNKKEISTYFSTDHKRQFFSIKGQGQKIGVLAQITTNNSTTTERQVKVS